MTRAKGIKSDCLRKIMRKIRGAQGGPTEAYRESTPQGAADESNEGAFHYFAKTNERR